jgi:hypothetical protein
MARLPTFEELPGRGGIVRVADTRDPTPDFVASSYTLFQIMYRNYGIRAKRNPPLSGPAGSIDTRQAKKRPPGRIGRRFRLNSYQQLILQPPMSKFTHVRELMH